MKGCKKYDCSDLLYGKHDLKLCHDCLAMNNCERMAKRQVNEMKPKNVENEKWQNKVKPKSAEFPKRTEEGHRNEYLTDISSAKKAAIALVHPVTAIKKYFLWYKRFRCESITLSQQCDETWAKLLSRTDLKGCFIIIKRTIKNKKKYICVNSEKVRQWLLLFLMRKMVMKVYCKEKLMGYLK